jgi:hypothetical protein
VAWAKLDDRWWTHVKLLPLGLAGCESRSGSGSCLVERTGARPKARLEIVWAGQTASWVRIPPSPLLIARTTTAESVLTDT